MNRRKIGAQKTFDQAPGAFIGVIVVGIIRLVIAGAMSLNFILSSNTVMVSTIVGAIVIPIISVVFFSFFKKFMGKDSKAVIGLRAGILAASIIGLIITMFGMSFFLAELGGVYSYTPFDAFVRDLMGLMEAGDVSTSMLYLIDDIFVIMILIFTIQAIILTTKSFPGRLNVSAPVQTQPPSPLPVPETILVGTGTPCGTCGALKLNARQKFCEHCGTAFPTEIVVQPAVSTEVSAPASVSLTPPTPMVAPAPTITPAAIPQAPTVTPVPTVTPSTVSLTPSPFPPAATGSRPLQVTKVDWNKVKDALKRGERKLEDLTGKAYQRIFKKTLTQRNTRICIGVISLVIVTCIILGASLTPARPLVGTWRTSAPVTFNVEVGGVPSGYELRTMEWKISSFGWDPNEVLIEVTQTIEDHVTDTSYTHDFLSFDLYGTISGSRLYVRWGGSLYPRDMGNYSFTSWIITGTWDDPGVSGDRVYTAINGLTLTKQ